MMVNFIQTGGDTWSLSSSEKVKSKMLKKENLTFSQAERIAYFWTRDYILEKINNYIKQRREAFRLNSAMKMADACTGMLMMLEMRRYATLRNIMALVVQMERQLQQISPAPSSRHYHFYNVTIRSVLEYCRKETAKLS